VLNLLKNQATIQDQMSYEQIFAKKALAGTFWIRNQYKIYNNGYIFCKYVLKNVLWAFCKAFSGKKMPAVTWLGSAALGSLNTAPRDVVLF
jgi:hypothetical protein